MKTFDLIAHLERQRAFSEKTFGPGLRTKGITNHIRKELAEVEADPTDVYEWIDLVILALDGAWRAGAEQGWNSEVIAHALLFKQARNEERTWPDWRDFAQDQAIEHDRSLGTCSRCGAPLNNVSPGFSITKEGAVCALCLGAGEELLRARGI